MTDEMLRFLVPNADEALDQMVTRAETQLPPTISMPIRKVFSEIATDQYYRGCNHILDFFELSAQYLSFALMRILQANMGRGSTEVLVRFIHFVDNKRPLSFGDWMTLFDLLLKTAKEEHINNPLVESLLENLCPKGKNILIENKSHRNIVSIRNQEFGHSTTPSEVKSQNLTKEMGERFITLIKAIIPIADCEIEIQESRYIIDFHPLGCPLVIDLFPFLYLDATKDAIYIFQTLKEEKAEYVSANDLADKDSSFKMNKYIDEDFQKIVPSFDIAQTFNWQELTNKMALASTASTSYFQQMKNEGKYTPDVFVERKSLSNLLQDFWKSEKTYLPLIGDAGQGKTNQLCYWTEKLCNQDEAVLMFNCSELMTQSLEDKFRVVFGYNNKKLRPIIKDLNKAALAKNKRIYLFLDALNEALTYNHEGESTQEGPLLLFNELVDLFRDLKAPRFKVIITCRSYTWLNVILPNIDPEVTNSLYISENVENIKGFSSEELETAYNKYKNLYDIRTDYAAIDSRVAIRLADPLIMKFASEIYSGKEMGDNPSDFTSLSLFGNTVESFAGAGAKDRVDILHGLGNYLLDHYLDGILSDGIPVSDLSETIVDEQAPLHHLASLIYTKTGKNISEQKPFTDLLTQNFIRKSSNGNASSDKVLIQFVYERFLEYILGIELWRRESQGLSDHNTLIPAVNYVNILNRVDEKIKRNVVFAGAVRNALMIDALTHENDFSVILQLESEHGDNYHVVTLVRETLNTMIRENYDQVFDLLKKMMEPSGKTELIEQYNNISASIIEGQIEDDIYQIKAALYHKLSSIIRLRKLASVSLFNGLLLTDYFNKNLYHESVSELVRLIMNDAIYEIRNDACMYAYYLSKKTHTSGNNLIKENLTMRIVDDLFLMLSRKNVAMTFARKGQRQEFLNLIEIACRLGVLMIIDSMENSGQNHESFSQTSYEIRDKIRILLKHFTGNFLLIKMVMPFFQLLMKKQLKFQSEYVNNVDEYSTFWDKDLLNYIGEYQGEKWERADIATFVSFIKHHSKYGEGNMPEERSKREAEFMMLQNKILSAYKSGHSFLYFVLERLLVVMGVTRWDNVRNIYINFFNDSYNNSLTKREHEYHEYSQMSLLYSMYQIAVHNPLLNPELLNLYGKVASEWTISTKGLFKGHRSHEANSIGKYKRNVMCWYAVVYGSYAGKEGHVIKDDSLPVPHFYKLIDLAIANHDKELLFHLIDNISELITDMGYIQTAKQLIKYILVQYDSEKKVRELDAVKLERGGIYQYDLVQLIGSVFSTAKNHFPEEIDRFIQQEISGLKFPGVTTYRENIVNYLPSGEQLSDLLTHKFGNFLMRLLLEKEEAGDFAETVIRFSLETKSSIAWYEKVVKYGAEKIFNLRL